MPPVPKVEKMKNSGNGRADISRVWAALSVIGAIVLATIYVLSSVHDISGGQVQRHEQKSLELSHPALHRRLEAIEKKLDGLRWQLRRASREESRHGP
jgi:hypothetical protein